VGIAAAANSGSSDSGSTGSCAASNPSAIADPSCPQYDSGLAHYRQQVGGLTSKPAGWSDDMWNAYNGG
jgi:hypothetical protein